MRLKKEQVLQIPEMAKDGLSNKEIGVRLGCSERTVDYWIVRLKASFYKMPVRRGAKKLKL